MLKYDISHLFTQQCSQSMQSTNINYKTNEPKNA